MKTDVVVYKSNFRDSEHHREQLQVHITHTSVKVHEDTDAHRTYQEQVIAENEMLRVEIQQLKQFHSRREQEHLHSVEDLNQAHKIKVDQMAKEHHDKVSTLSNESQNKVESL